MECGAKQWRDAANPESARSPSPKSRNISSGIVLPFRVNQCRTSATRAEAVFAAPAAFAVCAAALGTSGAAQTMKQNTAKAAMRYGKAVCVRRHFKFAHHGMTSLTRRNPPLSASINVTHSLWRSLKAWVHSFFVKPRMHQSMHKGSMARAASTLPMSAVSQPN